MLNEHKMQRNHNPINSNKEQMKALIVHHNVRKALHHNVRKTLIVHHNVRKGHFKWKYPHFKASEPIFTNDLPYCAKKLEAKIPYPSHNNKKS